MINSKHDFGVISKGGTTTNKNQIYIDAYKGILISTFPTSDEAKSYASTRRMLLTKNDKKYLGMGYKKITLSKSVKNIIDNL